MHLESRKATSKSALAARARTLHAKNLAWLEGFPLAPLPAEDGQVLWMSLPPQSPAEEIRIEGRHLSQAIWTLNKLRGDLAPGLPRLAGDPDAWLASIEHRIELLKGAVHHGRPLPPADSLPQVLSWVHAGDPDRARTVLCLAEDWSAGFGVLVERLGERQALLTMLRLLQLAADHGKKRVEALASCLFDERAWDVSLVLGPRICHQIRQAIASKPKNPLPEELPAGRLGRDLADWCEELAQQSRRTRQQALRLFEMAAPLPFLASWAAWWDELRLLLREARELVSYGVGSRRGLRARLEAQSDSSPPPLTVEDLFEALRRMTVEPAPGRLPALLRVLALSPAPGRTRMLIHWGRLGYHAGTPEARITALLAGFERYLRRKPVPDARLLDPWIVTAVGEGDVEDEILDREPPRRAILEAYDHLATLAARHGGLAMGAAATATELFFQAGDPALAARLFDSLLQGGRIDVHDSRRVRNLALRLCRDRPDRFADVLEALAEQEESAELPPSEWPESILGPLGSGELGDFVRESIVTGQLARLVACCTKSVLIEAAGELPQPTFGKPAEPDWLQRYPPELHPALCRLAAVLGDAEAQAARWLGSDFPDSGKLQREIEAIEARLEQADEARRPALLTRLANLQERIGKPAVPGPGRLERLRARLDRAWGRAVFDRWERELDARLPAALGRLLGIEIDEVPSCLAGPRSLALLAAAARLPDRSRALAFRLFAVRCGPPPWDLRDAPQNRKLVESLPRLDWSPWIDGVGTVTLPTAPRRLHLAL
ncbi:MAG TPA: ABC transporter C-terminal domain-containing protein, partial [Thermoanaerobaculia bacterium]